MVGQNEIDGFKCISYTSLIGVLIEAVKELNNKISKLENIFTKSIYINIIINSFIPNNEHFLKRARNIRNELLNGADRYVLSDYPLSLDQQMEIKVYRRNFR